MKFRQSLNRITLSTLLLTVPLACSSSRSSSPPSRRVDFTGPAFSTVKELAGSADVVVRGLVGKKLRSVVDNGGNAENKDGVPMALLEFKVSDVLRGSSKVGDVLTLAMIDTDAGITTDWETLPMSGEDLIMFLDEVQPSDAPGLVTDVPVYVTISGDNAVFSVIGDHALSRSRTPLSIDGTLGSPSDSNVALDVAVNVLATAVDS